MKHIIQIISLITAKQRREHISSHFAHLNMPFKFFDAVNKETLHLVLSKYPLNFTKDGLTDGEKACFLSHYLLWQRLCASDDNYLIVCEDDVVLSPDISKLLENLPAIMQDCDILKFETMLRPVVIEPDWQKTFEGFVLRKLKTENMGTAGYVVSKDMACHLVNFFKDTHINQPIDHYLFRDFLSMDKKVYQTVPAFAIQDDVLNSDKNHLRSDLHDERIKRRNNKRLHSNKLIREFLRLFQPFNARHRKEKRDCRLIANYGQIIIFKMDN